MARKKIDRTPLLKLKVQGLTYAEVAQEAGYSEEAMAGLLRPPLDIHLRVKARARGCCEMCGIPVTSGHIHHKRTYNITVIAYEAPDNLLYVCNPCHHKAHCLGLDEEEARQLCQKLKDVRAFLKIPQVVMGDLCGVSEGMIWKIEHGEAPLNDRIVRKIQAFLSMPTADVIKILLQPRRWNLRDRTLDHLKRIVRNM